MLRLCKRSCQCGGSKGEFPGKNSASIKRVHHLRLPTEVKTFLEAINRNAAPVRELGSHLALCMRKISGAGLRRVGRVGDAHRAARAACCEPIPISHVMATQGCLTAISC